MPTDPTDPIHPLDQGPDWEPFPEDIIAGAILWAPHAFAQALRDAAEAHALYAGRARDRAPARIAANLVDACTAAATIVSTEGSSPNNLASVIMAAGADMWIPALSAAGKVLSLKPIVVQAAAARHDQRLRDAGKEVL